MRLLNAFIFLCLGMIPICSLAAETSPSLTVCCKDDHELYRAMVASGIKVRRTETFHDAVNIAPEGSGVLLLADNYPHQRTNADDAALERSLTKQLRLYLEFPEKVPGNTFDSLKTTTWERAVLTTSTLFPKLRPLQILSVSGAKYLPTTSSHPLLSIARVAGFDHALFGLPSSAQPLLYEVPEWNALVATTGLSNFIVGRYGPSDAWGELWKGILSHLAGAPVPELHWTPAVRPAYRRDDKLRVNSELQALQAASSWLTDSRLLVSAKRQPEVLEQLRSGAQNMALPDPGDNSGDGSLGILEGFASQIDHDGTQRQCLSLRADCQAESAMLLAMDSAVSSNSRHSSISHNLLNYTYGSSGMTGGVRADPLHGAYGLISWGAVAPAWEVANYGDDNARTILGTWAAAALLNTTEWDEPLLRAVAANFRTTGRKGFRGDRIDNPQLAALGWKHFYDSEPENFAPNFEAWLWNCYLAAYQQTGYRPFLERTREGVHRMMSAYPQGWRWQDSNERSRMLFTMAWMVRIEDTPQHREWLATIADDLLKNMQPCGAIADRLAGTGGGHYQVPQSNETYGTGESPLLQQNGDPVSDQLYTSGFALLGLHEAAAVTGDGYLKEAEDRLAEYLVRIQVQSAKHPYLAGAWLRAFDFDRWDYWASAGDIGWGPWCAETGWGHTWIGTVLGLRQRNETLWDLLASHRISPKWGVIQQEMLSEIGETKTKD